MSERVSVCGWKIIVERTRDIIKIEETKMKMTDRQAEKKTINKRNKKKKKREKLMGRKEKRYKR